MVPPSEISDLTHTSGMTELIPELLNCDSFASLNDFILQTLPKFGIVKLAYHHLPRIGSLDNPAFSVLRFGFSEEFVDRFEAESLYLADPTIPIVMAQTKATWWGELQLPPKLSPQEQAFMDLAISQDFGTGVTLPVFGPLGRNGFVSIGFGPVRPNLMDADLLLIQMYCQASHLQYCDLLCAEIESHQKLSPREREILSWIAKGKSNSVIAEILGLKDSSIVTYLQRTFDKLGVNNRTTATLRALATGEIAI